MKETGGRLERNKRKTQEETRGRLKKKLDEDSIGTRVATQILTLLTFLRD